MSLCFCKNSLSFNSYPFLDCQETSLNEFLLLFALMGLEEKEAQLGLLILHHQLNRQILEDSQKSGLEVFALFPFNLWK